MIARGPTLNRLVGDGLVAIAERDGIAHGFEVATRGTFTDADELHLARGRSPDGPGLGPGPLRPQPRRSCALSPTSRQWCSSSPPMRCRSRATSPLPVRSVIVSAVRTPFGKLGGGLAGYRATELGGLAIAAALARIGLEPHEPQYVIMGQVLQAGAGQAPARQAAIAGGLPIETPADTINKVCASSIRAIEIADSMIRAGDVDVVVTGGMESMSNAPYLLAKARFGYRLGNGELLDSMVYDGLVSTFDGLHMVQQNSHVARELGISRSEQDAWAARSHQRAASAQDEGRFEDELVPVGDVVADESVRRDTTAREARRAEAGLRPGRHDDRRQRARRQRRRELRHRLLARSGRARRGLEPLATILVAGLRRRRLRVPRADAGDAGAVALERAGKAIDDVSGSRSTRRSPRSPGLHAAARSRRGAAST